MQKKMKNLIKKYRVYGVKKFLIYAFIEVRRKIFDGFFKNSYSQQGEDIIIDKLLNNKKSGFYVDIGANDPVRLSNTLRFYKKGWRGINVEPDIINYQRFTKLRPNDINLNLGVAEKQGELVFFKFNPDTLSTFSEEEAMEYLKQGYMLEEKKIVAVKTLVNILEKYRSDEKIDFMSVDTEGFDMQVLKSNDWSRFKPELICIESVKHTISGTENSKEDNHESFLGERGYKKVFDNRLNSIYKLV